MGGRLENKVCYITGAASGIGLACAERLSAESATVIGSDLRSSMNGISMLPVKIPSTNLMSEMNKHNGCGVKYCWSYGRIDAVITSAGVAGGGPVHSIDLENWQHVQDVNSLAQC